MFRVTQPCPTQPVRSLSFEMKTCCSSAFIAEMVSGSCLECVLRFHGQASQRLFGGTKRGWQQASWHPEQHTMVSAALRNRQSFLHRWLQPPPHPLPSLALPDQYLHRQLKIPAAASVGVHSSSLCLEPFPSILTWL